MLRPGQPRLAPSFELQLGQRELVKCTAHVHVEASRAQALRSDVRGSYTCDTDKFASAIMFVHLMLGEHI